MEIDLKNLTKDFYKINGYFVADNKIVRTTRFLDILNIKAILNCGCIVVMSIKDKSYPVSVSTEKIFTDADEARAYWEYLNGN